MVELHFAGFYEGSQSVDWHQHETGEFVYQQCGVCRHRLPNAPEMETRPGDLLYIPAGMPHHQTSVEYAETIYVGFSAPHGTAAEASVLSDPFTGKWMVLLHEAWLSSHPARLPMLTAAMEMLLALWCREETEHALPPNLRTAKRCMDERLGQGITPVEAARRCGMSPSYFSARFREFFGETPIQYLTRKRLELAARLLANPYTDLERIARQCGYRDANYLARRFRAAHGCSPSEYRKGL